MEAEVGMLPANLRWRVAQPVVRVTFSRWLRELVDSLPRVVARGRTPA